MNINEQLNNIARCTSILIWLSHSITTSLHASLPATHLGLINIIARVNASAFPLWRQLIKCGNNAAQHNTKTGSERERESKRETEREAYNVYIVNLLRLMNIVHILSGSNSDCAEKYATFD